jgi:tyrosine-protein phosphatase SIW14
MRTWLSFIRTLLLFAAFSCGTPLALRAQAAASPAPPPTAPSAAPAEKLNIFGISNAGRVNPLLYRGAQPLPGGYDELQRMGISIVIDLNNRGNESRDERRAVESRGMRYVSIPTSSYSGPTLDQIAEFLSLLRDSPARKIFVHCKYGADRSGVMIAAFRMTQEHWTPDQAMAEMLSFHFHRFWLPAMSHTVRDFPKSYQTSPAFAALRTAPSSH